MKIDYSQAQLNFKRRLKPSERAEYSDVLKRGKEKAACGTGTSMLIVPATSLPQGKYHTGVGNLATEEAKKFFEFIKQYWGINVVQLLPMGHYHEHNGHYPIYSGTSMDLGNHVINLEDFVPKDKLKLISENNKVSDKVNFSNVVDLNSLSESVLEDVFKNISLELKQEFEEYKKEFSNLLERKSLYRVLTELNSSYDYNRWNDIDKNLFNEDVVSIDLRDKKIAEIKELRGDSIEFYKFKNFLAEKSLRKAKAELNSMGIKLSGDMLCNFSSEEVWANPKAFKDGLVIKEWGSPVLDADSKDAEILLREKVNLYSKRYDGFRVDAAWTYITPNVKNKINGTESKLDNGNKFIDIIEDEVKKVKGEAFDLKNITYEFVANPHTQFNIYNSNGILKPVVQNKTKIYTSDYLTSSWGSAKNYLERGWGDSFIIGATNHDSGVVQPSEEQISALSKILNIPIEKLRKTEEFIKAKFAEPLMARNNMLFFTNALGLNADFKNSNYEVLIPDNYEDVYMSSLHKGVGFNPMDALEKQFRAQGLDEKEPELFKKIVKYRKILEQKETATPWIKICIGAAVACAALFALYKYMYCTKNAPNQSLEHQKNLL